LREQQKAQTGADQRDYVSLAALREAMAAEAPRRALAILQYGFLACALVGLVGSL
jgi:hypothetical protein